MLVAAGVLWSLTALTGSAESLPYSIGRVSGWLVYPVLMYLMLAFPDGRLRPGADRALYRASVVLIVVLFVGSAPFVEAYPQQSPFALCRSDCPPNAFFILDAEPRLMAAVIQPAREVLALLLLAGIAASLMRRYRTATALLQRTIGPLVLMSVVSIALLSAYFAARWIASGTKFVDTLGELWSLCVPGIAGAFFVGLLRRRLIIGEVLTTLGAALSRRVRRGPHAQRARRRAARPDGRAAAARRRAGPLAHQPGARDVDGRRGRPAVRR